MAKEKARRKQAIIGRQEEELAARESSLEGMRKDQATSSRQMEHLQEDNTALKVGGPAQLPTRCLSFFSRPLRDEHLHLLMSIPLARQHMRANASCSHRMTDQMLLLDCKQHVQLMSAAASLSGMLGLHDVTKPISGGQQPTCCRRMKSAVSSPSWKSARANCKAMSR